MKRSIPSICVCLLLLAASACTSHGSGPRLQVDVPSGFAGDFVLEMGVRDAPPLAKDGNSYVVSVPRNGKLETSTLLEKPSVTFKNKSGGGIWGFSQSIFTTGDGISVGGRIEFFVGTQKEFDAEQVKKNHSRDFHLQDSQA